MSEYHANLELAPKPAPSWTIPSKLDRRIFAKPTLWQRIVGFFRRFA